MQTMQHVPDHNLIKKKKTTVADADLFSPSQCDFLHAQ